MRCVADLEKEETGNEKMEKSDIDEDGWLDILGTGDLQKKVLKVKIWSFRLVLGAHVSVALFLIMGHFHLKVLKVIILSF